MVQIIQNVLQKYEQKMRFLVFYLLSHLLIFLVFSWHSNKVYGFGKILLDNDAINYLDGEGMSLRQVLMNYD